MSGVRGESSGGLSAVRRLEPHGYAEAGEVLARAFAEDPLWVWLVPDEDARRRHLPWLFERALLDLRTATIEGVGEPLAGVATWIPPGSAASTPPLQTLVGVLARLHGGFRRLVRYGREAARLELEIGAARSWRLGGLGVDPSSQGRGNGSALVAQGLARADSAGLPVILLTSNPANVGFYEGRGFAVEAERRLPAGGPPAWAMVHRPGDVGPTGPH